MDVNLVGKTEVWIQDINLRNVNLSKIEKTVAGVLELDEQEVMVADADSNHVCLDILKETLDMEQFSGKRGELFKKLSNLENVEITEETSINSEGILGMIALSEEQAEETMERTTRMANEVRKKFLKRVKIFPTGEEVREGTVKDTNSPFIKDSFESEGYTCSIGKTQPDDVHIIRNNIENAISEGYGIIITTGGIGAEEKDKTVEATERLDPNAATPYIVKYEKTGRHVKEGVRIGVGKTGKALIINLPGPHEEVKECVNVLLDELGNENYNKESIAYRLVSKLRSRWTGEKDHPLK